MTIETHHAATSRPAPSRTERRVRVFGRCLVVCWLLLIAGAFLAGERTSSFGRLQSDVYSGRTHEVHVVGGLPAASSGFSLVELHWRADGRRHVTEVLEALPLSEASAAGPFDGDPPTVAPGTAERLLEDQPGLHVTRQDSPGSSYTLLGQRIPFAAGVAALALGVITFGLVVSGPEPWRATRWAWVWLILASPPLGFTAFLLLGGATGLARPRPGARRLTGGWAFLLALLLGPGL